MKTNNKKSELLSWMFLVISGISVLCITKVESYNFLLLSLLLSNIIFSILVSKRITSRVLDVCRILVGILFLFSGFVKGVDPLGTQFKIVDYLYIYKADFAVSSALLLSIVLNAVEFCVGAMLVLRIKMKSTTWILLLMMTFFTLTTLYDALYNPVPDCGCFGDVLKISNWQTFYKNIIIDAFVIILFVNKVNFKKYKSLVIEWSLLVLVAISFISFEKYNINNLPIIDFRPWKVGSKLLVENPKPIKYFLTYKNTKTGEEKEFLSNALPWQDSVFMADWKWSSSRQENPNLAEDKIFPMIDADGNDVSRDLVSNENYTFIFTIYDMKNMPKDAFDIMNKFYENANGYDVVILTNELRENITKLMADKKMENIPIYNSDDTSLKAAIRSNPGLIVVKKAVVIKKYHYNNFPIFNEKLIKSLN